jgi:hypothetical protein
LQEGDSLSKKTKISFRRKINLINAIANHYTLKANYSFKKAKHYYLKALFSVKENNDSSASSRTYNNLAFLYNLEKNDSSAYFIRKGLDFAVDNEQIMRLYDNYADYFIQKKEFSKAFENIHKSLEINLGVKFLIDAVPTQHQLEGSRLHDYTLFCLKKKAEILIKAKRYEQALKNIEAIDVLVSIINSSVSEEATKLVWIRDASQGYLQGALAAHLLGDKEKVFYFMEKSKALSLSEAIIKNSEYKSLPKNVFDRQLIYKKQIYELENR